MLRFKRIWLVIFCLVLISSMVGLPSMTKASGGVISGTYGGKTYKLYVPSQYDSSKSYPLYVMLHGCTQDATQFSTGTKMNALSEEKGFLVLYPEQNSSANSNKCWNWFETSHQNRGSGEPSVIAGMVQSIKSNYSIQNDQVFVAGLSAGAAMSVIMGATYPDVFSGIGVGAGLEYKAATSMTEAFTAMSSGGSSPVQRGRDAYNAMGSRAKPLKVIVFHGTSDYTVNKINGDQVISQWAVTNSLAATGAEGWLDDQADNTQNLQVPSGKSYTVYDYKAQDEKIWMKKVNIQNMGHAWSGGSSQGSYTDPQGPDASRIMWEFFQSDVKPPVTNPVTTATPPGGKYNNSVSVELISNKPGKTYYTTDGTEPTTNSPIYLQPLTITENTTLKFFSRDNENNSESVKTETYTIETGDDPGNETSVSSIGNEDGFVGKYTADGKSNATIKVGDKGMYNTDTYRGILSFDTSTLTEPIESAKIRLYPKSKQGTISLLRLDIKTGVFGSDSTIEQLDYSNSATQSNISSFSPVEGEYFDINIPANSLSLINLNGITQFRLKADTLAGFNSNFIEFYGGETADYAPKLIINSN
ncbi:PHB depolymerase family esterase [Bacillus sp. Cr_A10]|uniref:extracellular catalytic domain type 1 short-chain-length polyhydroxyalkanoate depolymerase n=1 Tax=Bacillus sp. Cr_A10 TaxID=3033993 RepID=UPI0023DB26D0|nr:PHB depolymerase family esterase [Bacillus sp. Cr_A10]MDF2068426.1 PHB depolymerase family esterase [Bacillus sp. Cr_A10]